MRTSGNRVKSERIGTLQPFVSLHFTSPSRYSRAVAFLETLPLQVQTLKLELPLRVADGNFVPRRVQFGGNGRAEKDDSGEDDESTETSSWRRYSSHASFPRFLSVMDVTQRERDVTDDGPAWWCDGENGRERRSPCNFTFTRRSLVEPDTDIYCVYIATAESILLLFLQNEIHGTNVSSLYQRREYAFIVSSRYPMPFYKDGTSPLMCMCELKQYQASEQLLHLKYLLHAAPVIRSALIPIAAVLLERPYLLVAFDINDLFEELWLV